MADVGHEVPPHPLDAPQPRDVGQGDHQTALCQRDRIDGEDAPAQRAQLGLAGGWRVGGQRVTGHVIKLGGAEGRDQAHAPELIGGPLCQARGLDAGAHDPQPLVDHQDRALAGAGQQRFERGAGQRIDHEGGAASSLGAKA